MTLRFACATGFEDSQKGTLFGEGNDDSCRYFMFRLRKGISRLTDRTRKKRVQNHCFDFLYQS